MAGGGGGRGSGGVGDDDSSTPCTVSPHDGLVQRAVRSLFDRAAAAAAAGGLEGNSGGVGAGGSEGFVAGSPAGASTGTAAAVAFVATHCEVYNEHVYDLLAPPPRSPLVVRWDARLGFHAPGLTAVACASADDALRVLEAGARARRTGSHALNAASSRSHALFSLALDIVPGAGSGTEDGAMEDGLPGGGGGGGGGARAARGGQPLPATP